MESLDSWEIELALNVACSRCGAKAGERCIRPAGFPEQLWDPHIHPQRLSTYYEELKEKV